MTFRSTCLLLLLLLVAVRGQNAPAPPGPAPPAPAQPAPPAGPPPGPAPAPPAPAPAPPAPAPAAPAPAPAAPAPAPPAPAPAAPAPAALRPNDPATYSCPSGVSISNIGCDLTTKCTNADDICYRDMRDKGASIQACCSQVTNFCPITNMIVKHHKGSNGYQYKYDGMNQAGSNFDKLWYRREFLNAGVEGVACPMPYSYSLNKNFKKAALPVDWDQAKVDSGATDYTLKKCDKNADCKVIENEFCDAAYNPSFEDEKVHPGLDRSVGQKNPVKFCYKAPPLVDALKHVIVGNDVGLPLCNGHKDCGNVEHFCLKTANQTFRNWHNATQNRGICMLTDSCLQGTDHVLRAVLNVNSQFCNDAGDCENGGVSKGNADFNPHCRQFLSNDTTRKMCCYQKNPPCRLGATVTPYQKCKDIFMCNEKKLTTWNMWCDDGGSGLCCKDPQNKMWQCPDLATPLFNEPMCSGSSQSNVNSGTCPKKGGLCVHGHCCPPLIIGGNTTGGANTKLGRSLYRTEFPCDPKAALPIGFSYSFCESETKKIIVVGQYHDNGDKMTKVSGSKCTINADCAADGSQVCVYENDVTHLCYYNPLRPLRPQVSTFWKVVLIISLICSAVFLISTIVCFVCYRSKSVFDKYRPKKKKGKGSKGKDKDSKDSKDSKSKSKSKKGKKGGKKGKKAKDGDDGGSSSKSAKKDDASEGGKSELTDMSKSQAPGGPE